MSIAICYLDKDKEYVMDIKPEIVEVSEDNHRFKKRHSFRNKEVIVYASLITAALIAAFLYVIFFVY